MGEILIAASRIWNTEVGSNRIEAYHDMLGDMDAEVFSVAIHRLALTHVYGFPTPAHIVQMATRTLTECGVLPPEAEEAWQVVQSYLRDGRRNRDLSEQRPPSIEPLLRDHPTIAAVVKQMGGFGQIDGGDIHTNVMREAFRELYTRARDSAIMMHRLDSLPLPAPGTNEAADGWRNRLHAGTAPTLSLDAGGSGHGR